jgi:apolipoprotein N-acyltransferase
MEALVLAFLTLFAAGLCGYAHSSPMSWPAAALALSSISWAQHYLLIRRGLDDGFGDAVSVTLTGSLFNAFVATGGCYWLGVILSNFGGL